MPPVTLQPAVELGLSNLAFVEETPSDGSNDSDTQIAHVLRTERAIAHRARHDHVVAIAATGPRKVIATAKHVVGRLWQEARPEPLVEIITLESVRDSFSTDSQRLLNERLRTDQSFADRDRLARLYALIKKAILLPRDSIPRMHVAIAIERELRPLGLTHSWHPSFHVEVVRDNVYRHSASVTSSETGVAAHDRDIWQSLSTDDAFIPVRAALDSGNIAWAAQIIFNFYLAAAPEGGTRQARLERIWSGILCLLPPEERRAVIACVDDVPLLTEMVAVVGKSCARRDNIRNTDMEGYRLAHALAGVPAENLSDVMARLLAAPETEALAAWLLTSANLYGTTADLKALMAAYDEAAKLHSDCYTAEQVIFRQNVRETETGVSRLDPIGRVHQILKTFAELTRQQGGYESGDVITITRNLLALRDLLPQCPLELRQRVMQVLVDHYSSWANSRRGTIYQVYWEMVLRWQHIIEDEELQEKIELLTIRFAPAEKSFTREILTKEDREIKNIVNARNRNSRHALVQLLRRQADLRDVNLAGFTLNDIIEDPSIGRHEYFSRVTVTEEQFLLIAEQCVGLKGIVVVGARDDFIDRDLTLKQKLGCWEAGIPLSPKQEEELMAEILDLKQLAILDRRAKDDPHVPRAKNYLMDRLAHQGSDPSLMERTLDAVETVDERLRFTRQVLEVITKNQQVRLKARNIIWTRLEETADGKRDVSDSVLKQDLRVIRATDAGDPSLGEPPLTELILRFPRLAPIVQSLLTKEWVIDGSDFVFARRGQKMENFWNHPDKRVRIYALELFRFLKETRGAVHLFPFDHLAARLFAEDDPVVWGEIVKEVFKLHPKNLVSHLGRCSEQVNGNIHTLTTTISNRQIEIVYDDKRFLRIEANDPDFVPYGYDHEIPGAKSSSRSKML